MYIIIKYITHDIYRMMLLLYVRGVNEREGETKLSLDKKLLAVIEFNFLY